MAERRKPILGLPDPTSLLNDPISIASELTSFIKGLEDAVSSLDKALGRFDAVLYGEIFPQAHKAQPISPSYVGQTTEDYCLECCERHYSKALGLLKEAERFSLREGRITPEARERIRAAIEEIVTSEEDLGTTFKDPEMAKAMNEINVKQREIRKWMWAERLTTTQQDLSKLKDAIAKVEGLVNLTYKAAEFYHSKYGRCSYCEGLATEVAEKFNLNRDEVSKLLYGLVSDSKERIAESADRMKKLGIFDYVLKRTSEILEGLKSGKR